MHFLKNVWKSPISEERKIAYLKALQRLLLFSTSGAFFFSLIRVIPTQLKDFSLHPDFIYTFDRLLRYMILLWFLAYFFASSVNNDLLKGVPKFCDICFDLLQSLIVLISVYVLGFVDPNSGLTFNSGLCAFGASDTTISIICFMSLLFWKSSPEELNYLRILGGVVAISGVVVSLFMDRDMWSMTLLLVIHVALWIVWFSYLRIRLDP